MVVGPFINGAAIVLGGLTGALLARRLPERLRTAMPLTFGAASMSMGVILIMKGVNMPVMVLSAVLGALIGELCYVEKGIGLLVSKTKNLLSGFSSEKPGAEHLHDEFLLSFVALIVLFCASGTGIFGSMHEGMTGDATVLIAKSFLDLVTAAIFATTLGYAVVFIAIPQLVIQLLLAWAAGFILPLTTPNMQADFSAVGGLLMLVTGFRIAGIKPFPVANMLPALILAMPVSALWERFF